MSEAAFGLTEVDKVAGVIGRVFQGTPSAAEADGILHDIAEVIGEDRAIGFTLDPFSLRIDVRAATGFDRDSATRFMNNYAAVDPWLRELIARNAVSIVIVANGLPDMAAKSSDPRGQALSRDLTARGISCCAGAIVRVEDGALVCVCVYSSRADGFPPAKLDLFRLIVRQIGESAGLRAQRRARDLERRLLTSALDLCQMPVCIVDARSVMTRSNAAAQNLLRNGDILQVKSGRLTAADASDASRLAAQIARVTASTANDVTAVWHTTGVDGSRLVAMISPLRLDPLGVSGPVFAFITITDLRLKKGSVIACGLLSDIFGLTEAEERVARLVESGLSVAAAADLSGLSVATIRSHLSRIFEKTDCASQTDLVRVLTLLGPFKTSSGDRNNVGEAFAARRLSR